MMGKAQAGQGGRSAPRRSRARAGVSVIEVVLMLFITTLVGATVLSFCQTGDLLWSSTTATQHSKDTLYLAINKMAPFMRDGLRVDPSSTASEAVIVCPKVDTVNGGYLMPLTDGDTYRFYLSDLTGAPGAPGTILWMSINGTPDTGWSLKNNTRGAVDLGDSNLSFSYYPAASPDSVQVTLTTTKTAGHMKPIQTSSSATIVLRNCQVANQ